MITIKLIPIQTKGAEALSVELNGTILTINSTDHDLSIVPDGATIEYVPSQEVDLEPLRQIDRDAENYVVTLYNLYEYTNNPAVKFSEPIIVTQDGTIELPPHILEEI